MRICVRCRPATSRRTVLAEIASVCATSSVVSRRGSALPLYGRVRSSMSPFDRFRHPPDEGHLFVEDSEIDRLARLSAIVERVPGPPASWDLNVFGQPEWLLQEPGAQTAGSWGVIVPPAPTVEVPPTVFAARARDRRDQGLPTWGADKTIPQLRRVLEAGPASMPAITWDTKRPILPGNPSVTWTAPEVAMCAAWLADVREATRPAIAKLLFPEHPMDDRALRRKVGRYIVRGRQTACDQGLWPWIAVPLERGDGDPLENEGTLVRGWWQDQDVLAHLTVWHEVTLDRVDHPEREADETPGEVAPPW